MYTTIGLPNEAASAICRCRSLKPEILWSDPLFLRQTILRCPKYRYRSFRTECHFRLSILAVGKVPGDHRACPRSYFLENDWLQARQFMDRVIVQGSRSFCIECTPCRMFTIGTCLDTLSLLLKARRRRMASGMRRYECSWCSLT